MAKPVALEKRAKISEAEKHMIIAVLCASIVLGVAASLVIYFVKQISFNAGVIVEQDKSIAKYSSAIKDTGVCKSPKDGKTYSVEELKNCDPNAITISEIPGTLRSNILNNLAANEALNSVPKENSAECYNSLEGRNYTYKELKDLYDKAGTNPLELQIASVRLKNCSALRIVPDALPAYKNVEALNASLDKLFRLANQIPENINNNGTSNQSELGGTSGTMYDIAVNLSINSMTNGTNAVLDNIERSIRQFDFQKVVIEWESATSLGLQAQARAYYMDKSTINEKVTTMKPEDQK